MSSCCDALGSSRASRRLSLLRNGYLNVIERILRLWSFVGKAFRRHRSSILTHCNSSTMGLGSSRLGRLARDSWIGIMPDFSTFFLSPRNFPFYRSTNKGRPFLVLLDHALDSVKRAPAQTVPPCIPPIVAANGWRGHHPDARPLSGPLCAHQVGSIDGDPGRTTGRAYRRHGSLPGLLGHVQYTLIGTHAACRLRGKDRKCYRKSRGNSD